MVGAKVPSKTRSEFFFSSSPHFPEMLELHDLFFTALERKHKSAHAVVNLSFLSNSLENKHGVGLKYRTNENLVNCGTGL